DFIRNVKQRKPKSGHSEVEYVATDIFTAEEKEYMSQLVEEASGFGTVENEPGSRQAIKGCISSLVVKHTARFMSFNVYTVNYYRVVLE
ncbi:hypothetical protein, partial [Enterococcus casseliflavus]|uniref:hypothetical protein n=1 Tax=Enterococcus casseliflavus TaxID=37734 RepID=UPI003D10414F